jgi:phage antirepressor YoqD-like protein
MLRLPGSPITVHRYLSASGPMTLAGLAYATGITQARLRTHLRSHRDAYTNETHTTMAGIKLRLWLVIGEIK